MHSSANVEEAAADLARSIIRSCGVARPIIACNDRTALWDGDIHLHSDTSCTKDNLIGRIPVQVKGTQKPFADGSKASYKVDISSLRHYRNDGGCLFLLATLDSTSLQGTCLYYADLRPTTISAILNGCKPSQKQCTIHCKPFPVEKHEIVCLLTDFLHTCKSEQQCVSTDVVNVNDIKAVLDGILFKRVVAHNEAREFPAVLLNHKFHAYAKVSSVGGMVPLGTVEPTEITFPEGPEVSVGDQVYFETSTLSCTSTSEILGIGTGIQITVSSQQDSNVPIDGTIELEEHGTISQRLADLGFLVELTAKQEFRRGSSTHRIVEIDDTMAASVNERFSYWTAVSDVLNKLDVRHDDLDCDNLTDKDVANLNALVRGIQDGNEVAFSLENGEQPDMIFAPMRISNLCIMLLLYRTACGRYKISPWCENGELPAVQWDNEMCNGERVRGRASTLFFMNRAMFADCSNFNPSAVTADICIPNATSNFVTAALRTLLEMLRGYDAQKVSNLDLLRASYEIATWLQAQYEFIDADMGLINFLQVKFRLKEGFTAEERRELMRIASTHEDSTMQWAAALLLEDEPYAKSVFQELTPEEQQRMETFPIWTLWESLDRS